MANWFGNKEKDDLLDEMKEFLNSHPMNNLKILLAQKGKKPSELAEYLGVSRSLVSKWISGKQTPNKKHDEKIGEFFSSDSLSTLLQEEYTRDMRSICEIILPMTKDQKINVIQFILGTL